MHCKKSNVKNVTPSVLYTISGVRLTPWVSLQILKLLFGGLIIWLSNDKKEEQQFPA